MALEATIDNTEHEFKAKGWNVMACVHKIFIPTKQRTKTGKPVMMPVTHRWIDMLHVEGEQIRFYLGRNGRFSDSRQKSKDCALLDAYKGYDKVELLNELHRMTGDRHESARAVFAL